MVDRVKQVHARSLGGAGSRQNNSAVCGGGRALAQWCRAACSYVRARVKAAGIENGVVNVLSRHTTTAVTINEAEGRLMDDVRQYLTRLAPPGDPYLHNDLHLRRVPVVGRRRTSPRTTASAW